MNETDLELADWQIEDFAAWLNGLPTATCVQRMNGEACPLATWRLALGATYVWVNIGRATEARDRQVFRLVLPSWANAFVDRIDGQDLRRGGELVTVELAKQVLADVRRELEGAA